MDTDNDGIVSIEELKAGFRNFDSQLAESEIQMFIEAVSMVNSSVETTLSLKV
jgi:calcium-dependent protein kinase